MLLGSLKDYLHTGFDRINSAEFLQFLQSGSEMAFEELVANLASPLTRFMTYVMDVPETEAEDLVFEVFAKVEKAIKGFKYDGSAKLTTWIIEIAKNRAVDFHRAHKSTEQLEPLDEQTAAVRPELIFVGKNQKHLAWVQEQLAALPETDRLLLIWHAKGFTFSQIAQWLQMTEVNARVRHSRLLNRLRTSAGSGAFV